MLPEVLEGLALPVHRGQSEQWEIEALLGPKGHQDFQGH